MSHICAIKGVIGNCKVQRAIISVYDKTGIEDLGCFLAKMNVEILSTGGSYKKLEDFNVPVKEIASYTGSPEMFGGRVKTLHPKIHGGLLFVRGNEQHEIESKVYNVEPIDLVVCNLYPFKLAVLSGQDFLTCSENIDIGGPCMIRAAAKNFGSVCVITAVDQYKELIQELSANDGCTTPIFRKRAAAKAFQYTAEFENQVASYFAKETENDYSGNVGSICEVSKYNRNYKLQMELKYGCNPHQLSAAVCSVGLSSLPFRVLNGMPGYINVLDAVYAWQLVHELKQTTGLIAAASFKHCSPAGVSFGAPLTLHERQVFDIPDDMELSEVACAYIRARNGDPMCSFGDFASISGIVDEETAKFLKSEVSDGIIAAGFTEGALDILKAKKKGNFIILEANVFYVPPDVEYREIYGVALLQNRNDIMFSDEYLRDIKSDVKELPENKRLDMIMAGVTTKYTQSNSVALAYNQQLIGIGAGQQSRIDCVKLAVRKSQTWFLRNHPKVLGLKFRPSVKRQEKVNAKISYINGEFTDKELEAFTNLFHDTPEELSIEEKISFLKTAEGICMSSDAFFPFRDNIDTAAKHGVKYIVHPGGSVNDEEIIEAANEHGIVLIHSNLRLFLH